MYCSNDKIGTFYSKGQKENVLLDGMLLQINFIGNDAPKWGFPKNFGKLVNPSWFKPETTKTKSVKI